MELDEAHPDASTRSGLQRRAARLAGRRSTCWSRSPSRPAARACSRSTRRSPRSRTSSPAKACSWSSTAPTRSSSASRSRPRSTAWRLRHAAGADAVREGRRLRADDGHHRHRDGARARARRTSPRRPTLGPSISSAFIATLMGVGSANVIFLPVANRLKAISAEEVELRSMTARRASSSVQAGDNPRFVAEKLLVLPRRRSSAPRARQSSAPHPAPALEPRGGVAMAAQESPRARRHGAEEEETPSAGCSPTRT